MNVNLRAKEGGEKLNERDWLKKFFKEWMNEKNEREKNYEKSQFCLKSKISGERFADLPIGVFISTDLFI